MASGGCGLRVGTVTAVDAGKWSARVRFDDRLDADGHPMISDWLQVVQRLGTQLHIEQFTEQPRHNHMPGSYAAGWMPAVNDQVLVLYDGVANGRGYILGGVIPWR